MNTLRDEHSAELGVSQLPTSSRLAATTVLTLFSTFGALTAFKLVPEPMIVMMFGYRANRAWIALQPYIEHEREFRSDPEYATMYEHLVSRTRDNWPPPQSYGLKLQRLVETSGDPHLGEANDACER